MFFFQKTYSESQILPNKWEFGNSECQLTKKQEKLEMFLEIFISNIQF